MSEPSLQYVCPQCGAGQLVSEQQAAWAVACFACGAAMQRSSTESPAPSNPAAPMAQPVATSHAHAPQASIVPQGQPLDHRVSAAKPVATEPIAGESEVAAEDDAAERSWLVENLGMVLAMIALVGVAAAIVILALSGFQFGGESRPTTEVVISKDGVKKTTQPTIVDASKASIRRSGVKVGVRRVQFERLWARDENNSVVRSVEEKWIVHLRVNNQVDLERDYKRWGPGSGAELTASTGENFPLSSLEGWSDVLGKTSSATLPPGEVIRDIVVFDAPNVSFENVQWLRLRLPAAVFGGEGDYWFETPAKMIEGPRDDPPPPNWMPADMATDSTPLDP